jgi:polar amino acid transport system substrate-binding protein
MNKRSLLAFMASLSIVTALLFSVAGCGVNALTQRNSSSALEQIITSGTVKVGYLVFPPAITKDPKTGQLSGHFVATIKDIARLMNWKLEFVETDWAGFPAGLNARRFQLSIVPTFVTVPRSASVYFSNPLFFAGNSAIARIGDRRFTTIESIDQPGITVAVTQGEAGAEFASANFKKVRIVQYQGGDQSLAFQSVISRRADVALGDAFVTAKFSQAHSGEVMDLFADKPYNLTPVSWAVRQGDDTFLNFINNSLQALDTQGRLKEWERQAGANWLHLKRVWQFTS